jgi:hypothetical protein
MRDNREEEKMMSEQTATALEDEALWVVAPAWVSPEQLERLGGLLKAEFGEDSPVVMIVERDTPTEEEEGAAEAAWAPVARVLLPIAVEVAKPIAREVGKHIAHTIRNNRHASQYYERRAERWNADRDRWWAQQMGRG